MSNSGTGQRIITALGSGNKTLAQIQAVITAPSGKPEKQHHLKHWLTYLKKTNVITMVSGTKWYSATWGLV